MIDDSKDTKDSKEGTKFIGVRISNNVHQRLYRAKASLEFSTGKFYGMGRLIERVLKRGLTLIERELENPDPSVKQSDSQTV